jgi:Spy/CpxP family protein refolding chaperone
MTDGLDGMDAALAQLPPPAGMPMPSDGGPELALGPDGGPPDGGPGGPPGGHHMHGMHGMHGHGMPGMGGCGGGPFGALQGPLAISDDQFERLYGIKTQFDDSMGPKKAQMHTLGRKLRDALCAADLDAANVKSLQSQMSGLMSDIGKMHSDKMLAYAQVLTPDQRKAIRQHMIRASLGGEMMHGPHHPH